MSRLILVVCTVALLAACGCGKKPTEAATDGGGGGPGARKDAPPPGASVTQVIEDFLAGANPGTKPKVVMIIQEEKTTFRGKSAQAVAAKYSVDGKDDSELFLIQDEGKGPLVVRHGSIEKPFAEALKELLKD